MMSRGGRNIDWIQRYCRVPEGRDVGKEVVLRDWQIGIVEEIYGSRTRKAIISFPRKNGKTAFVSFLLLLHLVGPEAKKNSQLYSAAQSRDQAALLFNYAWKCVRMSPGLAPFIRPVMSKKELHCEGLGAIYKALAADAGTVYGLSPIFAVHDEIGQVRGPTSELYDAIETAMGAHSEPMSVLISTQAATDNDLFSREIDDAKAKSDPATKLFMYSAPEDADPYAISTLRMANPALGDFLFEEELIRKAEEAKRLPTRAAMFRNLHLNQRIEQVSTLISPDIWKECGEEVEEFDEELPVYGGLDLSETQDLTAFVLVQWNEGKYNVKPVFWLPKVGIREKSRDDKECYDVWADEGWLELSPGRAIGYEFVAKRLKELFDRYNVVKVGFDRYNWKHLKPYLEKEGFEDWDLGAEGDARERRQSKFIAFGQGMVSMAPAVRTLEQLFLTGSIRHGMNPVLTMCARNVVVVSDDAGNRKPSKARSRGRIDGITALLMALSVAEERKQEREDGDKNLVYVIDLGEAA